MDSAATVTFSKIGISDKHLEIAGPCEVSFEGEHRRTAQFHVDGKSTVQAPVRAAVTLTCLADDGTLPSPDPAVFRNYAR